MAQKAAELSAAQRRRTAPAGGCGVRSQDSRKVRGAREAALSGNRVGGGVPFIKELELVSRSIREIGIKNLACYLHSLWLYLQLCLMVFFLKQ